MPLIFGKTSGGVLVPVLVDSDGDISVNAVVSALPALATGTNVIGKIQANSYGLVGGAFQKDPIRLGYSDVKTEQVVDLTASAGTNTLFGSTVPAGEIWVLEAVCAYDLDNAIDRITIWGYDGGISFVLEDQATVGAGQRVFWTGALTLSEDGKVFTTLTGVTLNDDIYLKFHGRRIDIDQ